MILSGLLSIVMNIIIFVGYADYFRTIENITRAEIKSKFGLCKYKQDPHYANTVKMCTMQTRIM